LEGDIFRLLFIYTDIVCVLHQRLYLRQNLQTDEQIGVLDGQICALGERYLLVATWHSGNCYDRMLTNQAQLCFGCSNLQLFHISDNVYHWLLLFGIEVDTQGAHACR